MSENQIHLRVSEEQLAHLVRSVTESHQYWYRTLQYHLDEMPEAENFGTNSDDLEASYFLKSLSGIKELLEASRAECIGREIRIQRVDTETDSGRTLTTVEVLSGEYSRIFFVLRTGESFIFSFVSIFDLCEYLKSGGLNGWSFCCEAELEYFLRFSNHFEDREVASK